MKASLLAIIVFIILSFNNISAQSFKDRSFNAFGVTYFTDYYASPLVSYQDPYAYHSEEMQFDKPWGLSIMTFSYKYRFNIVEMSDNVAFSTSVNPALAVSASSVGIGSVHAPIQLNMEFGAGSTYNTTANMGGYVGAGFELNSVGLVNYDLFDAGDIPMDAEIKKTWLQPVISAGVRFWGSNNVLREVEFKYGWSAEEVYTERGNSESSTHRPRTIRVIFNYFLNY